MFAFTPDILAKSVFESRFSDFPTLARDLASTVIRALPYYPKKPYQTLVLSVPSSFPTGAAQLNVAHFFTNGPGSSASLYIIFTLV
ncbi:hypothetical protein AX15_001711 [Amanita polypyramis BW_CC]|nr:hypothetical protein AX15_001711 [Amanita polypyramis BW_CC]